MLTLLRILLLSSLVSCGVKIESPKDKYNKSLSFNIQKVPFLGLKLESVNNLKDFILKPKQEDRKEILLKHYKRFDFFSAFSPRENRENNKLQIPLIDTNRVSLHFKLTNNVNVCFVKFEIFSSDKIFERFVYQDDIRDKSFSLEDIPADHYLEYNITDFKYCNYEYSLQEFLNNLKNNHYQVNISFDNFYERYMVPSGIKLKDFLFSIDNKVKINQHNKLDLFMGRTNAKRLSPINQHPDNHGFWFTTGLVKDNFNYSPGSGKTINLDYILMKDIRRNLSQKVTLTPDLNGIIEIKNKGKFLLRDIYLTGNITHYINTKKKLYVKSKKSLVGGKFKKKHNCYVNKHKIQTLKKSITNQSESKEVFDQLVSRPYPERFVIKSNTHLLSTGFENINCKHNIIKYNKKVFILANPKKNYTDIVDVKLVLTKELIVL